MECRFTVVGSPAAQGSKRLVRLRNGRTAMLENSAKVRPWRQAVAAAAVDADCKVYDGDVIVWIRARWLRPKSHLSRSGEPRKGAPTRPSRADVDKIARSTLDALTGVAYRDDRQVVCLAVERVWCADGEREGADIIVMPAPPRGDWNYIV